MPGAGNAKAYDRYAYAEWNPIRYSDPSGHFIFEDVWQEPGNHSYTTGPYTHGETYFYSPSSAEEIWGIEVSIRVSQQTANDPTGFGGLIGIGAAMTPIAIQSAITNQPTYYSNDFENIIKRLGDDIVPQGNTGRTHANPPEKVLNLPIRNTAREKTSGVLIVDGKEYVLISGRNGPASEIPLGSSGFNGITKTHVEGHAAAIMKQNSSTYGTLWINNTPCESCNLNLPYMLPNDAIMRVIVLGMYDKFFIGW